jgi:hypothetical protein
MKNNIHKTICFDLQLDIAEVVMYFIAYYVSQCTVICILSDVKTVIERRNMINIILIVKLMLQFVLIFYFMILYNSSLYLP